jgi:colicin import membrane protein
MIADQFSRNIVISLGLHLAVAVLIFFRAAMMPSEPIQIRNAIRVDVVGLPQKMKELPEAKAEKPAPAPAAKELPKKTDPLPAVKAKPIKEVDHSKKQKDAFKKLQERMNADKEKHALEEIQKAIGKEKTKAKAAQAVAGNKVNAGNSLEGIDRLDYDKYFDDLKGKVHGAFSIPQWLADANLQAKIQVMIDDRGYVIKKVFKQSSGNDIFDAKVSEAIDSSSPFPPPPSNLRGALASSGVIFNFPQ